MDKETLKILRENISLKTLLVSLLLAAVSLAVLAFSDNRKVCEFNYGQWCFLFHHVSSLVFATAGIALLWELAVKRNFIDEMMTKAGIAKDLQLAGILKVTDQYLKGVEWAGYFKSTVRLDIFFAYGATWRNTHTNELRDLSLKHGARIRVILPDPENEQIVAELARRFTYPRDEVIRRIRESEGFFRTLQTGEHDGKSDVSIYFLASAPVFSFYVFDQIGIVTLYSHRQERISIPAFVCETQGSLYKFLRGEFDSLVQKPDICKDVSESGRQ